MQDQFLLLNFIFLKRMQHQCDTSNTSETRATQTKRLRHECYKNNTSATRVKNFDLDNYTSKNLFSYLYIYYMVSERLQGEEQYHSENYLLEMPRFQAKMRLPVCNPSAF